MHLLHSTFPHGNVTGSRRGKEHCWHCTSLTISRASFTASRSCSCALSDTWAAGGADWRGGGASSGVGEDINTCTCWGRGRSRQNASSVVYQSPKRWLKPLLNVVQRGSVGYLGPLQLDIRRTKDFYPQMAVIVSTRGTRGRMRGRCSQGSVCHDNSKGSCGS